MREPFSFEALVEDVHRPCKLQGRIWIVDVGLGGLREEMSDLDTRPGPWRQ